MKYVLFVLCALCATTAFGQSTAGGGVLNAEPQLIEVPSHPAHAMQQDMGLEQNLLGNSSPVWAHGERPLWEVAPKIHVVPLGDIARDLRKEHATAKKALIVWDN
jgi:hypothetical protein